VCLITSARAGALIVFSSGSVQRRSCIIHVGKACAISLAFQPIIDAAWATEIAAAREERFSRQMTSVSSSSHRVCLRGRLVGGDLDAVVFYDKPITKFARLSRLSGGLSIGSKPSCRCCVWRRKAESAPGYSGTFAQRAQGLLILHPTPSGARRAPYPSAGNHLTVDGVGE
jgi:hypothetical protein